MAFTRWTDTEAQRLTRQHAAKYASTTRPGDQQDVGWPPHYPPTSVPHTYATREWSEKDDAAARQHASAVVAMASRPHKAACNYPTQLVGSPGCICERVKPHHPAHGALSDLQHEDAPEPAECSTEIGANQPEHDATGIVWGPLLGTLLWSMAAILGVALWSALS